MARIAFLIRVGLVLSIVIANVGCIHVYAEDPKATVLTGYITAVQPPDAFDVKGTHVAIVASTRFLLSGGSPKDPQAVRREINVGAHVQVTGTKDGQTNTVVAAVVEVRDETAQAIGGAGVIDRVIVTGAEPVFRADGYTFRINSDTDVRFSAGLASLAEVGTNTWVRFEGRRNDSGEVVVTKASFVKPKRYKRKQNPLAVQVTTFPPGSTIDSDGVFHSEHAPHKIEDEGEWCGWYPVPENDALQERVRRIGMSLVPQYQRDLPDDDSGKIPFRFYAVDKSEIRSEIFCDEGLIVVPFEAIQRLGNDDQLAALLADGIAAQLQRQEARMMLDMGLIGVAEATLYFAARNAAGSGAAWVGGAIAHHEIERKLENERGRVALGLMADTGFDPWQAPETWRLLVPGHLPKDPSKLKYPERSLYLLGILDLQYKRTTALSMPVAERK